LATAYGGPNKEVPVQKIRLNDTTLRIERARRDWPWWRVAAQANIAPTTLSAVRNGHRPITTAMIAQLEQALGLEPGALMLVEPEVQAPAAPSVSP